MDAVATVRAYHERTKHRLDKYAAGPGSLDWDAQPSPFRRWSGTEVVHLPRDMAVPALAWDELLAERRAAPPTLANLSVLLRHAVAITAWKQYGAARWSLRAHPSSGNLHPTETWLCARGIEGLDDGLYHYQPEDHSLERRADFVAMAAGAAAGAPALWLGFTTIAWREAWKYGERAFRYCQLDLGHVLGAVACSAALLGWRPRLQALAPERLDGCLGLDRAEEFAGVEREEAEAMLVLYGDGEPPACRDWHGRPSLLDARPMYQWPVIDEVAEATRGVLVLPPGGQAAVDSANVSSLARSAKANLPEGMADAAAILLKRRSAQAFDDQTVMPLTVFRRLLGAMLPGGSAALSPWPMPARIHPVLLVHRVEGIATGLYCLPRAESGLTGLAKVMRGEFAWAAVDAALPLYQLIAAKAARTARTLSCHQDIASQGAFTVMFVAEFAGPIAESPAAWRHLHWEAGLLGHALTLAAEADGWRGTGIGCFFDDADHEILGLAGDPYQVIYHFAVGIPVDDDRLTTLPAYD
ncbi:MAG: nitroreductase family protein [Gallionellaceae bacterium]|nr:nitroreductase family protein [Gallionellaceae bacterium]